MTTDAFDNSQGGRSIIAALRLVYSRPEYAISALFLVPTVGIFYAWAAQVLIVGARGLSLLIEPDVIAAILVLATLFAITMPLQVYAARLAATGARQLGGSVLGIVTGTVSMSCCAPVLLPAALSLIGFSGTTILSVNLTIHRYFVPLALLGAILLGYSLVSTASSLGRACALQAGDRVLNPT